MSILHSKSPSVLFDHTMKFFVVAAVLLVGASASTIPTHPLLDGRIIGGQAISIAQAPHQVSLQRSTGSHFCGGSIVAPTFVVTAAHCTDRQSASALTVRAGTATRGSGGVVVNVAQINQHPGYNSYTFDNDITVLRLASSLSYSASIQPIGLPSLNQPIVHNIDVIVTGWGTQAEGTHVLPSQLQSVTVQTISNELCGNAYAGVNEITARMMCAGVSGGGKDACEGDSGGPLISGNVLLGITSWGYGCARPNYPGVYSSVPNLRGYIQEVAGI